MHLTREADYALRIIYTLAQNSHLTDTPTIADTVSVSRRFVLKILSKLASAELVKSKLGVGGGYYLAREACDITVADVIEAIEGPITISTCLSEGYNCERIEPCGECVFHCMFSELNADFIRRLRAVTIADAISKTPCDMAAYVRDIK